MKLLSTVVDWQHGTLLIIPEVCVRIFPNFTNTEAAFEWCSKKVVVLQKYVIRCSYCTFVVKTFEKKLVIAFIFSKVASL